MRVGVDTGGTFTDVVADDGTVAQGAVDARRSRRARCVDGVAAVALDAPDGARARHDGGDQRAARAPARPRRAGDDRGLRRRDRDRPPGPAVALRRRTSTGRRRSCRARCGSRWAGGSTRDGRELEPFDGVGRPTSGDVDAVAVCLLHADLDPAHERAVAAVLARARATTSCARTRCRPSSASTSAWSRRWSTPRCGRCAAPYLARPGAARRRGAGDDVGRRPGAARRRGRASRRAAAVGSRRRRARRGRGRARRAASPTRSRSTWAARAPTSASCAAACPSPPATRRSPGYPSGCRRSTSTPSAPAAARSPALDPGGALRGRARRARAPIPGPACYGRGGTEPTVTDADLVLGRIPADAAFAGLGRLDVAAARAALDARRRDAPRASSRSSTRRWSRRCARSRSSGASTRATSRCVAFGGAGPLHACALADALGHARRSSSRRAPACSRRSGSSARREQRELVRVVADAARRATGSTDARAALGRAAPRRSVAGRSTSTTCARLPLRGAEPRAHRRRRSTTSPPSTRGATATPRPDAPVEVVALRAARRGAAPLDRRRPPGAAARRGARARRSSPSPTARSGCPTGWARRRRRAGAASWIVERRVSLDPAALQVLISRLTGVADEMGAVLRRAAFSPNIKERADCSAALFTADGELLVQAEHIPVHLGSMPASVRGGDRRVGGGLAARRPDRAQRPVRRRHPPQRHHARRAVLRRRPRSSAGSRTAPTTPTSAASRPGSMPADATEIHAGGPAHPAGPRSTDEVRGAARRRRRARPTSGAATSTRSSAPTGSASSGCAELVRARATRAARRGRSTTASAGCAPRSRDAARRRVARSTTCSTRPARARAADADPRSWSTRAPSTATTITFDFTGTDAQRPGNVNAVEAVTVSAVAFALRAVTDPDDPGQRRRAAAGARRRAARARSSPRCRRPRSAPATSR